jgi:signal peptidase I
MILYYFSESARMQRNARNWLHLADKVYHFRRDRLTEPELAALTQERNNVRQKLKTRADASVLKLAIEGLEPCLRQSGGPFYPKSTAVEYVEFFLVAAILFLGIRAFILQPFKIPTNSMSPSFYGMTGEVYATPDDEPNLVSKMVGFAAFGATTRRVNAPASGDIRLPIAGNGDGYQIFYRTVPGRRWLLLPTRLREYSFMIGDQSMTVKVPTDFDIRPILSKAWFGDPDSLEKNLRERLRRGKAEHIYLKFDDGSATKRVLSVPTGKRVSKGDRLLSFDILTGDQLFVDRISYHFVRPKVGDGFVFRTRNIDGLARNGKPDDKYYIKRLVGTPGNTLEIREPKLYRNGEPITGSPAFAKNADREGLYRGYQARNLLKKGKVVTVPKDGYFAMGDNSYNSLDSRVWGFVPEADVVGRPLLIYYPFTRRWGPTD